MAIEAARRRAEQHEIPFTHFEFREVTVGTALVLTDDVDAETVITLRPCAEATRSTSDVWDEFRICSWTTKRGWTEHCSGIVRVRAKKKQQSVVSNVAEIEEKHIRASIDRVKEKATYKIDLQNKYQVPADVGAGYGPAFQGLENCFSSLGHSFADLYLRDTKSVMPKGYEAPLTIHPVFLDALLHLDWPILGEGRMKLETLYMPTMIKNLVVSTNLPATTGDFAKAWCNGGPSSSTPESTKFDLWATPQDSSEVFINIEGLIMTPLKEAGVIRGGDVTNLCYKLQWLPLLRSSPSSTGRSRSQMIT